jgi:hypothetical protein
MPCLRKSKDGGKSVGAKRKQYKILLRCLEGEMGKTFSPLFNVHVVFRLLAPTVNNTDKQSQALVDKAKNVKSDYTHVGGGT